MPARNSIEQYESNGKLKIVTMLLARGAVISLLFGLILLAVVDTESFAEGYMQRNLGMSLYEVQEFARILGYELIGCGAVCLISAIVVMKRVNWILAFVLTLIAAALGFDTSILGGILGPLCFYYIYGYRLAFE